MLSTWSPLRNKNHHSLLLILIIIRAYHPLHTCIVNLLVFMGSVGSEEEQ